MLLLPLLLQGERMLSMLLRAPVQPSAHAHTLTHRCQAPNPRDSGAVAGAWEINKNGPWELQSPYLTGTAGLYRCTSAPHVAAAACRSRCTRLHRGLCRSQSSAWQSLPQ
jgi:hypothetical protein